MRRTRRQSVAIKGQSHFCDGYRKSIFPSRRSPRNNVVRDDSDHCEAGHPNRLRTSPSDTTSRTPTSVGVVNESESLSVEDISSVGLGGQSPAEPVSKLRFWKMYSGRVVCPAYDGRKMYVASHPRTVEAYGDEPVSIVAIEDPEGAYWGWIDSGSPERGPVMIQPHEGLFRMQFPYGPKKEAERGKGEIIRLRVEDA